MHYQQQDSDGASLHATLVSPMMQVWLKQPLVDLAEITVRHDIVETFTSDPLLRESLRDQHLRGVLLLALKSGTSMYPGVLCCLVCCWR